MAFLLSLIAFSRLAFLLRAILNAMSNQLGNHKNVLGISSQSWAIILVPVLPGLPIHLFLAETMCLPIPLPYKKSPCSGQMLCTGLLSLQLFSSEWNPMGKGGVCVCGGTFSFLTSNLPASCQRLFLLLFFSGFFFLPLKGFTKEAARVPQRGETGTAKGWMDKEENWKAELSAYFTPFPSYVSFSWVTLTLSHTLGPAISIQKMEKIWGRYMVQRQGNCFGGKMKRYLLYGLRRSRWLGNHWPRGMVPMEGGEKWAKLDMTRGKGMVWQEQAGRGVLQSLKCRGDVVWVVAHRELMSGAAGGSKAVLSEPLPVCAILHPSQAGAVFK